ncbi:MAG: proliferating cell nuclear antigen (pcna) [Promethearchaeota archaeon]
MVFKAELDDPKILRGIVEAISFLVDETNLIASSSGLKIMAIDNSRVAMLHAELQKDLFNNFTCDKEYRIGISINDMIKILRRAKSNDKLELLLDTDKANDLSIIIRSEKSKRTFRLKSKIIQEISEEIERQEQMMEQLEETFKDKFTATITMEGNLLDEILKDASIVSDIIKIQVLRAENEVDFMAYDDSGEVEINIDMMGSGVIDKQVKDDAEGLYSLNFLENILKIQSVVSDFEISIGHNIPMKLEGRILAADDGNVAGRIIYILAPRVDEEDEYEDDFDTDDFDSAFDDEVDIDDDMEMDD